MPAAAGAQHVESAIDGRRSWARGRPRFLGGGKWGWMRAHWASVSSLFMGGPPGGSSGHNLYQVITF
jgi:hypothetical protein